MSYPPTGGPPGNEPPSYNPPPGGYGGPPPSGPPPGGAPYGGQGPYGEPPKTSPKATWALVTGILGLCCGPLGIAGIILGRQATADIEQSNGQLTGAGMAKAGFIIGTIAVVLWALSFVLRLTGVLDIDFSTN